MCTYILAATIHQYGSLKLLALELFFYTKLNPFSYFFFSSLKNYSFINNFSKNSERYICNFLGNSWLDIVWNHSLMLVICARKVVLLNFCEPASSIFLWIDSSYVLSCYCITQQIRMFSYIPILAIKF